MYHSDLVSFDGFSGYSATLRKVANCPFNCATCLLSLCFQPRSHHPSLRAQAGSYEQVRPPLQPPRVPPFLPHVIALNLQPLTNHRVGSSQASQKCRTFALYLHETNQAPLLLDIDSSPPSRAPISLSGGIINVEMWTEMNELFLRV